jgi:hypothetical protein
MSADQMAFVMAFDATNSSHHCNLADLRGSPAICAIDTTVMVPHWCAVFSLGGS